MSMFLDELDVFIKVNKVSICVDCMIMYNEVGFFVFVFLIIDW